MNLPPPPPPLAIVQDLDLLKNQNTPAILSGELYEQRTRELASSFSNVVVAGLWNDVLRWTLYSGQFMILLETDMASIPRNTNTVPGTHLNMATQTWFENNNYQLPSEFSGYNEILSCAIFQGRGAMRGAIMVCVDADQTGQPFDPGIFDMNYREEVGKIMFQPTIR
ncbi:MAG: hypothetical protein EA395_14995 [Phormidium sp. GEM2.Bin31]|nr:MAG: hypothetical protein EA395_14995 [Phormidium sp. GEM2.Bin31]